MAVNKPNEVKKLSKTYKNKIYVSLDIKDNNVMVNGWKQASKLSLEDILRLYRDTEIRGFIITDIRNDGMLKGLDTIFVKNTINKINNINSVDKKIVIAGGLTNYSDLRSLKKLSLKNIEGIISGKSFYVGNIDLMKAQKILNTNVKS